MIDLKEAKSRIMAGAECGLTQLKSLIQSPMYSSHGWHLAASLVQGKIMKVYCYPSFNEKGNRIMLVRVADLEFSKLPESLQEIYRDVEAQENDIDINDFSCRWWLCKPLADNLLSQGWDASVWAPMQYQ
jgi:hypothetical protein